MDNADSSKKSGNNKESKKIKGQTIITLVVAAIITFVLFTFMNSTLKAYNSKEIPYSEFMSMVEKRQVKSVQIENTEIEIKALLLCCNIIAFRG